MMDGKNQETLAPAARPGIMGDFQEKYERTENQEANREACKQEDAANKETPSNTSETEHPEEEPKSNGSNFKHFLRVFTYNDRKGWIMNAVAGFCMVAAGTALPLMDVIFGQAVDAFNDFAIGKLSPAGYRSEVAKYSLYFVYIFLGKFALTYTWTFLINVTAIRTTKQLRIDFVKQMLRQEIPFFDTPTSSLSGQVTTNGNLITLGISEKFGLIIEAISSFFAAFVVAFIVQWKLALIIISIVPVNLIVSIICIIFDTIYEYQMFEIYGKAGSIAEEAFSTIRTAHAFWAFPKLSNRYNRILEDAAKVGAKKSLVYAILFPTEFFCIFSAYALAFWQGMRMFADGEVSVGKVVTVVFAVLVAAQALTQIAPQTIVISKATAAAADLFSVIDRKSNIDSLSEAGERPEDFGGNIKFEAVQFEYPSRPDVPVLRKLNLKIPADKTTALVGASGSGKSTVCGLLERWYLPSGGRITLDGQPIEDLNLQWLRTNIRLVQQEPTLFSGSIYQNVVDGLSGTEMANLPEEEKRRLVEESCQAAYAHDFISELPRGYDTVIGERGASLSGGQKQRVVIARSIISNPKVLLLDEATSALDPRAEKIVQQALNNVAKGRTMVVIAHRLSTIRDADNIIVLSKGDIIENGTHDELVELDGAYARLIRIQDLGRGSGSAQNEDEVEDQAEDNKAIAQVTTAASASAEMSKSEDTEGYSLLSGMILIHKEQSALWLSFLVTYLSSAAGGVTYPALAILFSKTMEAFETVDVGKANFFALMFFVVALGNLVAYAVAGWTANIIAQHIMKVYRSELFSSTLRQDMTFFDKPEHSTGSLVSRLSSEPTSLQELMSMNLALILINVVNVLSSSIVAIAFGWKLGLVLVFGALPVLVGSGYLRIRLEYQFENDTAHRFAQSSGKASEAVMAIRTVSSLALERAIVERYRSSLDGIARKAISGLGWRMFFYSLTQSVLYLCMGLGFWYGGQLVSTGEYTSGQFYTVFIAVLFSGQAAAMFFSFSTSVSKAKTAMNYIFALRRRKNLNDLSERDDSDSGEKAVSEQGTAVEVNDVSFAYPLRPKLQVLKSIDVNINSGQMIAFVGASGCGKSTMIALLQRFYDPVSGQIRMDEKDIKDMHRQRLRRSIALVQQEPVLYQGSIRDNIALGIEEGEPDDDAITDACRQANAWEFVSSLPEGLSTPCGAQGFSLSGGQRQRIAIARALIRRPRLLLLDEATSALDTESEKVVKEALDRAAAGRTTIAVAHRLSTICDADMIIVFDRGGIAQMGTHEELIAKKGLYYEMVLGQSLDREAA